MSHGFERRRGLGRILLLSVVLGTGCIHRQTDLEWARSSGSSIDTSGSTIRGKSLEELEVMVEPHGVRRWRPPMEPELVAGSPYGMRTHPIKGGR